MTNTKKIIICIVFTIALIISIILGVILIISSKIFDNPLKEIQPDIAKIPNYVVHDTLYSSYGEFDMEKICMEQDGYGSLLEVFCVYDGRAYLVSYCNKKWVLASLDLNTMEMQSLGEITMNSLGYNGVGGRIKDYQERHGYYHDGTIVLNNYEEVLSYNLEEGTAEHYSYEEYNFPEKDVNYTSYGPTAFRIDVGDKSYEFYLSEIAEENETVAELYKFKASLRDFWSEFGYRVIDDKIYTVGRCMNNMGESFAVIMEYDCNTNEWKYIKSVYVGDVAYHNCYIIP